MKEKSFHMTFAVILIVTLIASGCAPAATPQPASPTTAPAVEEPPTAAPNVEAPPTAAPTEAEAVEPTEAEVVEECTDPYRVAFVLSGPATDQGWAMSHDVGRQYVQENLPCVETTSIESVASGDVERVARDLASKGYDMIFTASLGFMEGTYLAAQAYPEVLFENAGGYKRLPNMSTYFGKVYQTRFLAGIVAGMMTKNNKIGYVTSFQSPEMFWNLNGFAQGIKTVNPDATINVVWTNTFYDPVVERTAAEALADLGVDVIGMHQNSPNAMIVADERGIYGIGYQLDMRPSAPNAVLTTVAWNWGPYYLETVKAAQEGTWESHDAFMGLETGVVRLDPYGDMVPQEVKDTVAEWEQKILSGEFKPFTGPLYDNEGNLVVPEGVSLTDEEIREMTWLLDNVISPKSD